MIFCYKKILKLDRTYIIVTKFNFCSKGSGQLKLLSWFWSLQGQLKHLYMSNKYTKSLLKRIWMQTCKSCLTPITIGIKLSAANEEPFEDPSMYKSVIGRLQYTMHIRPYICYPISKLSQFSQNLTQVH